MRPSIDLGDVIIARPFLSVPRARLRTTALASGLEPVDDPMNADVRFERVRIRQLMPALAELGLDADALAAASERLGDAADAVEHAATAFLASAVATDVFAVATVDIARFAALPHAVGLRVLARVVIAVGGDGYQPRRDPLLALHHAILTRGGGFKRTLGGTVIHARKGEVAFYREVGRAGLPSIRLRPGDSGVWDHRYSFAVAPEAPRGLMIAAHGLSGEGPWLADGVPKAALAAIPVVLRRGRPLEPSPIDEGFPSDSLGYVTLLCLLQSRLNRPLVFPDFVLG
jgi:tRNA(Ile)-lysidine synthase